MLNIENTTESIVTIPFEWNDAFDFELNFTHHLSGKRVQLFIDSSTQALKNYAVITIPALSFKYLGLYSFKLIQAGSGEYLGLAKVTELKAAIPTYSKDNKKDYELYK